MIKNILSKIASPKPVVKTYAKGDIVTVTVQYTKPDFGVVCWLDGVRHIILISELAWFGMACELLTS